MELSPIFTWLYERLLSVGLGLELSDIIALAALAVIVFGVLSVIALFLVWWERKFAGHIQQRYGPMMTGWHGVLQTVADAVKYIESKL